MTKKRDLSRGKNAQMENEGKIAVIQIVIYCRERKGSETIDDLKKVWYDSLRL